MVYSEIFQCGTLDLKEEQLENPVYDSDIDEGQSLVDLEVKEGIEDKAAKKNYRLKRKVISTPIKRKSVRCWLQHLCQTINRR